VSGWFAGGVLVYSIGGFWVEMYVFSACFWKPFLGHFQAIFRLKLGIECVSLEIEETGIPLCHEEVITKAASGRGDWVVGNL
jgi:hypothetical protein